MKTTYGGSEIGVFERLPLRRLRHPKRMVRESVGDIDDLAESIREKGLLEPLVVRPHGDLFEIVAGNRRYEACKKIRKKSVACHIVDMDDASSYEESLIENLQRQNMNPVEEGIAFRKYVDDYGFGGMMRLARAIGKSESYVSRRIALVDLPESITKSVVEGRLSSIIAQELIPLKKGDAASLAKVAEEERLSRDQVRSLVRGARSAQGARLGLDERPEDPSGLKHADRVLNKAMTTLKVSLMRLDWALDSLDDEEWMLKELLYECMKETNQMVDRIVKMRIRRERLASTPLMRALSDHRSRHGGP